MIDIPLLLLLFSFVTWFAVEGIPLLWFNSYLTNRSQSVSVDGVQSKLIGVDCSLPQGSILGPLELISFTEDVVDAFTRNLVRHHLFADDKQLYRYGKISEIDTVCVTDIRDWCSSRRLQLNALKTELQSSRSRSYRISPSTSTMSWQWFSLIGNKSASINYCIAESSLRLAAVLETRHDSFDCPDLIACALPGWPTSLSHQSVTSCTGCQHWIPSLVSEPSVMPAYSVIVFSMC